MDRLNELTKFLKLPYTTFSTTTRTIGKILFLWRNLHTIRKRLDYSVDSLLYQPWVPSLNHLVMNHQTSLWLLLLSWEILVLPLLQSYLPSLHFVIKNHLLLGSQIMFCPSVFSNLLLSLLLVLLSHKSFQSSLILPICLYHVPF